MTDTQNVMFVNLYQSYSILWDTTYIDYKNNNCRQDTLEDIVKQMDIPAFGVSQWKLKINNMRLHYCQKLKS